MCQIKNILFIYKERIGHGDGEFATCVLQWGRGPSQGERFGQGTEINTKKYWKSVRLLLFTDLGCDTLTPAHYHTFVNNFERKGGVECRLPNPSFDAWCLVTGKPRNAFDTSAFLKCYISLNCRVQLAGWRLCAEA